MKFEEKMLRFRPDAGLMYLVQQVTGQETDEILGFFYDFSKQVFIEGMLNMKYNQREIRKKIEAMYPGTAIPFLITVDGRKDKDHSGGNMHVYSGDACATFPQNPSYMNVDKLMDVIVERQLLGASSLPPFEPPLSKTPKMYRKLIKEILVDKGTTSLDGSKDA